MFSLRANCLGNANLGPNFYFYVIFSTLLWNFINNTNFEFVLIRKCSDHENNRTKLRLYFEAQTDYHDISGKVLKYTWHQIVPKRVPYLNQSDVFGFSRIINELSDDFSTSGVSQNLRTRSYSFKIQIVNETSLRNYNRIELFRKTVLLPAKKLRFFI